MPRRDDKFDLTVRDLPAKRNMHGMKVESESTTFFVERKLIQEVREECRLAGINISPQVSAFLKKLNFRLKRMRRDA